MPTGDGTGAMGMGAMTGHPAGYGLEFGMPGYNNSIPGRGCGRGRGGRGHRNLFYATGMIGWQRSAADWPGSGSVAPTTAGPTREQQLVVLKGQAEHLEGALGDIGKRIEELEAARMER